MLACPRPSCGKETCRGCGEAAHIPLRCDEVERAADASGRQRIEEAMTAARLRKCPGRDGRCGKPFFKTEGCNKMTCPSCKTHSCYICRQVIPKKVGYARVCQTAHCDHRRCGKCVLSRTMPGRSKGVREAGLAAQAAVADDADDADDADNANADNAAAALRQKKKRKRAVGAGVDVDALLEAVPGAPAAAAAAPAPGPRGIAFPADPLGHVRHLLGAALQVVSSAMPRQGQGRGGGRMAPPNPMVGAAGGAQRARPRAAPELGTATTGVFSLLPAWAWAVAGAHGGRIRDRSTICGTVQGQMG